MTHSTNLEENNRFTNKNFHVFLKLSWIGLDWIGLDWIGLDGLDWVGLDWIGLDCYIDNSLGRFSFDPSHVHFKELFLSFHCKLDSPYILIIPPVFKCSDCNAE